MQNCTIPSGTLRCSDNNPTYARIVSGDSPQIKNASYTVRYKRRVKHTRGSTLIYRFLCNFCSRTHVHAAPLPGLTADGPGSLKVC